MWQLDERAKAALALSRAQATQIYAGLKLWPAEVMAKLVEAQLVADGTYPNAAVVFAESGMTVADSRELGEVSRASGGFWPGETEPRDWHGRWMRTTGTSPRMQGAQVAHAGEDPFAGGDPNIEENLERTEKEQQRPLRIGPDLVPREKPDGTIEPADPNGIFFAAPQSSRAAPAATPVTPSTSSLPASAGVPRTGGVSALPEPETNPGRSTIQAGKNSPPYFPEFENNPVYRFFRDRFTASPKDLATLKSQMPSDIARHMIDGFIGPGPFAQEPIKLSPTGEITDEMIEQNDVIGYGFGCHRYGAIDPMTKSGSFILDHEVPEKLNFGIWAYRLDPHCLPCARKQGGHVTVIKSRLRVEGWIP